MKRLMQLLWIGMGCAALFLAAGCALFGDDERPADITLEELMVRRQRAMDPSEAFAKAESFVQRQVVVRDNWFGADERSLIETRFLKPDHFQLVSILDNRPASAVIYNGTTASLVDYQRKAVYPIEGHELEMIRTVFVLGTPGGDLTTAFSDIALTLVEIDGVEYYKMHCVPKAANVPVFNIYVDAETYLTRMIRTPKPLFSDDFSYDAVIDSYANWDDVVIPERCTIMNGDRKELSTLVHFRLNVKLDDADFEAPKF